MSRGVLIYAFNNGEIDYEAMARWNAKRIKRFLGLDTTIISDSKHASAGGTRIFDGVKSQWLNASRSNAWEDSPYDETIVVDADYIVNSDVLLKLFDSPQSFLIHQTVSDASGRNVFHGQTHFGQLKFPQSWATVFYFNRDQYNKSIFDIVKTIKEQYNHFADIYKFPPTPFRNDYAFSIALGMIAGHIVSPNHSIPWPLATASTDVLVEVEDDIIKLNYTKNERAMTNHVRGLDIHVMHKKSMEAISAGS
tara:strand:- start:427 stop:1179 length:753 start_codon:yes stop_codon:yes gene_type:complete